MQCGLQIAYTVNVSGMLGSRTFTQWHGGVHFNSGTQTLQRAQEGPAGRGLQFFFRIFSAFLNSLLLPSIVSIHNFGFKISFGSCKMYVEVASCLAIAGGSVHDKAPARSLSALWMLGVVREGLLKRQPRETFGYIMCAVMIPLTPALMAA